MNSYPRGNMVQLYATFTDMNGNLVDPTTVACQYVISTGSTVYNVTTTQVSTGVYTANLTTTIAGTYTYRFTGTGAVTAAQENAFIVVPSVVLGS